MILSAVSDICDGSRFLSLGPDRRYIGNLEKLDWFVEMSFFRNELNA